MKKIIFFSKNLEIGGMEKALVNLVNNLSNFYDTTLVLEEKKGSLLNSLNKNIKIMTYKLSSNKIVIIRKFINYFKRLCWSFKNKNKYDFACNYATYSYCGSKLCQIASKNSVLYVHSNYFGYFNGDEIKVKEFFNLHHLEKFNKIIFVSNESMQSVSNIYKEYQNKFVVINNLVDYENITKLAKEKVTINFSKENFNLLFVGRLDNTSKNFPLLISTMQTLPKKYKLYIIGSGYYKNELINLIKENKLEDRVTLLGEKINPYPYMVKSDALILTSHYEGFPVIYLEALVLNKKVITTVPVSDGFLDVRHLFTIVNKIEKDISKEILKLIKDDIDYKINLNDFNKYHLKNIKKVIEGEL